MISLFIGDVIFTISSALILVASGFHYQKLVQKRIERENEEHAWIIMHD